MLCRGWLFLIGETYPSGFGLWETKGVLPIATYPDGLRGWDLVVDTSSGSATGPTVGAAA